MTLNRQFWYVLIAVLSLSFVASFVVTTSSAVRLFEQQLVAKNNDNANVLAQTLSAMDKDPTLLELTLAAQFDTGFYQRLTLTQVDGTVVVDKRFNGDPQRAAPAWFGRWMGIEAPPATALVSDGWQQYGELRVQSQAGYAVDALWQRTLHLLVIFLAVAVLAVAVVVMTLPSWSVTVMFTVSPSSKSAVEPLIVSVEPSSSPATVNAPSIRSNVTDVSASKSLPLLSLAVASMSNEPSTRPETSASTV